MQTFLQDVRYGIRMLIKTPVVTMVAAIALTLGIGANTAIFSVVDAVLIRSLPYGEADRLVTVWETRADRDQNVINLGNFFDWKEQNHVFEDMAAFFDLSRNLTGDGEPEEVPAQIATTNLFSVLRVNAIRGRTFLPDDGKPGQPNVIVISYGLWQRRFGGDEQIVNRKILLNNQEATIIGVLPAGFTWHLKKTSMTGKPAEMWSPWQVANELRERHGRFAMAVARMKAGVSLSQAKTEMSTIGARLTQQYPEFNTNWGVNVVGLRTQFTGDIRKALLILLGAVAFVLLIACANVANLLLARASSRQKEIALRIGLGANRWRIVRQLLTENLLLALIGGGCGLLLAWWGTRALLALSPPALGNLSDVRISWEVLTFTMALSLLTGLIFGLVPALEAARFSLQDTLKEGGKNIGGSARGRKLRSLFVVAEVALSLVLLVGAGLLIKSLNRLQSVDPGFNPNNLLTMRVSLATRKYDTDAKALAFFKRAEEGMRALPGVESAGAVDYLPFNGPHSGTLVEIDGRPKLPPGQGLTTGVCVADAHYFETMQIPLKRGRMFTETEVNEPRHVVVVNERFAHKNLPGEDPIGKRVIINMKDENVPSEIIGVVGDNKHKGLDADAEPMSFWPHAELVNSRMTLVLRTHGDPISFAAAAREVIRSIDPEQPVANLATMESLLGKSTAASRFNTLLLTIFAVVALVLSGVGIYGVMSYAVTQRTHEIGVRMALGAQYGDVLRLVVRQGILMGSIGVGFGLLASFGLTRLLATLLFGVTATDMTTFVSVSAGLLMVVFLACFVPARRATKVDPLVALRYE